MIVYLYVSNDEFDEARPLAEQDIDENDTLRFRNPDYFGQPGELHRADKVLVYGKHDDVFDACVETDTPLVHLTYDGQIVESGDESKTPSMQWLRGELKAYAEANGITVRQTDTKADIMEMIDEAGNR